MESRQPNDLPPRPSPPRDWVAPTPEPGATMEGSRASAAGPRVIVAIAGGILGLVVLAGMAIVLALGPGEEAPDETAAASAIAPEPPAAAAVEPLRIPVWSGSRRARWERDGSRSISFELEATQDVPVWMARARPVLVVRCLYRATDVFVVLGTSAAFEAGSDRRTVRLQWDDEAPTVQQWERSETGRELFAPEGVDVVRRLARGKRLRFGFTPYNAQPVTLEFAVQGFEEMAGLVASTCRWRLDDRPATRAHLN